MMYDPMTGEPIQEETPVTPGTQAVGAVKSVVSNLATKKWFLPALIGGSVGVVGVVAAVVLVISGAFMTPVQKVAYAAGNTFKEAGAVGDLLSSTASAWINNKNTMYLMMGMQGQSLEMEIRKDGKDKQVWAKADIAGYPELEGTLALTKNELQAQAPILGDYVFVYDYTAKNKGALIDELDEEVVTAINKALAQIYEGEMDTDSDALKEMVADLTEWMDEIEIEEVEKEEFEINGKDVKCPGYEIAVDEGMLTDYMEIIWDGVIGYMEEKGIDEIEGYDEDMFDKAFDEMVSEFRGMPDMIFTVYIDSNMLAAIYMEMEDEEGKLKLLFEGGDYRTQNVTLKANSQKVFQLKGETDGSEETGEWIVFNGDSKNTILEYEYDKKSGDFEVVFLNAYGREQMLLEGNIVCNANGVEVTDAEVSFNGQSLEFEFSCKKGATLEKLKGDRFDIGNADEDEFKDLVEDLQDELEDLVYPGGGNYYPDYDIDWDTEWVEWDTGFYY